MSFNKIFNATEQIRLKQIVKDGCIVHTEIADLKEGLRETVKDIAKEMDIRPALLNKAISVAHKNKFIDEADNFDALETILTTCGLIDEIN